VFQITENHTSVSSVQEERLLI